jgi:hypothetical protein
MSQDSGLMYTALHAVMSTLPWKSLKSQGSDEQELGSAHDTGQDYYMTSSRYQPPDMRGISCPSAQILLQGVISNVTKAGSNTRDLTHEARLLFVAVRAGNENVGGLQIKWDSHEWLARIPAELEKVSISSRLVFTSKFVV